MRRPLRATFQLLRQTLAAWLADDAPSMGAALAFYSVFSLAPLLLIVIALVGWLFGEESARAEILRQLGALIGPQHVPTLDAIARAASRPGQGIGSTLVGVFTLVLGATTVFAELENAMDRIWHESRRATSGGWSWLRTRLLSLGLVLAVGFLLIVSLVASAALAAFGRWWSDWFGEWAVLAHTLNAVVTFACISVLFALIYKWLPQVRVAWRDVVLGAVLTALLFTLGKTLIGWYIGSSGVASPFGAAASVVVLLAWVYYSAQILLFGAEFTVVFSRRYGSLRHGGPAPAVGLQPAAGRSPGPP